MPEKSKIAPEVYNVFYADTLETLALLVNDGIAHGLFPVGGVAISFHADSPTMNDGWEYAQAMVSTESFCSLLFSTVEFVNKKQKDAKK